MPTAACHMARVRTQEYVSQLAAPQGTLDLSSASASTSPQFQPSKFQETWQYCMHRGLHKGPSCPLIPNQNPQDVQAALGKCCSALP